MHKTRLTILLINFFLVEGHEEFAKSVLPRFYKHNTFASFVRQLNMYDFHKIPHIQQGVLVTSNVENEVWEFSNPNFRRDRPDLLVLVTRKRNRDRDDTPDASSAGVNLNSLVKEIGAIKQHQTNITADLKNLHRDNEIIWKETIVAREKHQKHQLVISKILQFLTAVFSNEQHQLEGACQDMLQQQEPPQFSQLQPGGYDSSSGTSSNNVSDESDTCQMDFAKASIHNSGNPDAFEHVDSTNLGKYILFRLLTFLLLTCTYDLDANPPCATMAIDKSDPKKTPSAAAAPIHFGLPSNKIDKGKMPYDPTGIISRSAAQFITHDIDELQGNVETLAAQLGIDSTQFPLDNKANNHLSTDNYSSMISNATENDKLRLFELATISSTTTTSSHTRPKLQHQYHTTENIRVSAHYSSSSTSFPSPHSERYHDPNVFKQFLSSVNQYNNDNLEEPPTLQHVNKTPIYQSNSIPSITSNTATKDANVKKEKEEHALTNVEARRLFLSSLLANQQLQEQKYANLQHQQQENANFVDTALAPNATFTQPPYIRSNHSFPTPHHHTGTPFSTHYQPPTMPSSTTTTTTNTTTTALPSNSSTNFNNNDLHNSFNNVHQLEQHISLMNSTNNTNSDTDYSQQMVEASNFMNQNESKKEDRTIVY